MPAHIFMASQLIALEMELFCATNILSTHCLKLFTDLDMDILKIRSSTAYLDIVIRSFLGFGCSPAPSSKNNNKKMEIIGYAIDFNKMLKAILNVLPYISRIFGIGNIKGYYVWISCYQA